MNFFNQSLSYQQEDVEYAFKLQPGPVCPIPHELLYQQQNQNPFLIHENFKDLEL